MCKMYTEFDGTQTVKQLMQKYKWRQHKLLKRIDVHKFVLFGCINNLIRRIHRYPVILQQNMNEKIKLFSMCDGTHCFDEICYALNMNQKQIKMELLEFEHVILLK